MHYNLKGTDVSITPEIRSYLEKKLQNLEKVIYHKDAVRADVELHYVRDEARVYRAEIMFHDVHLQAPLRVEARGQTLHEVIDVATGELFTDLTRAKKKRLHVMRRGAARVKDMLRGLRERF